MLNVSIIDDDKLSRHILKKYIDKTNFLTFEKEYESAVSALEDIDINTPDLIILDVEMPKLSGLEFLERVELKPQVIITSINCDYAVKAFDFDVIDFFGKTGGIWSLFTKCLSCRTQNRRANEQQQSIKPHLYSK